MKSQSSREKIHEDFVSIQLFHVKVNRLSGLNDCIINFIVETFHLFLLQQRTLNMYNLINPFRFLVTWWSPVWVPYFLTQGSI